MKPHHKESIRSTARATLTLINARVGQNFFTLRQSQVEQLLQEADQVKYRKPRNANGSRARYFYERLQRHATMKIDQETP